MEPWYKRTFLWGQTNLTEDDPVRCDIEAWKKYWKESRIDGVIINCGGIVSYYQSSLPHLYPAASLGKQDYFEMWNKAARQAGLTVVARMDINVTTRSLYDSHPDWYCRDKAQNPILSQGRYVTCVNGGYYREFIPAVLREVISKYHPDGFADNSWAGLSGDTICYCENCKRKFLEEYGLELPEKANWEDPVYRKWVRFQYALRVKLWNYFNAVTMQAGGEHCKWFGMINADPFQTGGRFYDIRRLIANADFIFCDHQTRDADSGFEQNSVNGALLRMASREDNLVAESMAHYYKGIRTFRLSAAPKQEVLKWMLTGISGGIQPWYHFVGGRILDGRRLNISAALFRWWKDHKEYFKDRENCAAVGVIWNQENNIYYGRDKTKERCTYPWLGFLRALSRAGIPFLPIHADDISRYRERLQTIILPNVAILGKEQESSVLDFLKEGKNLIFSGVTGWMDAEGEWKKTSKLWSNLGLYHEHAVEGANDAGREDWKIHSSHNYIGLGKDRHQILEGFEETSLLPFGGMVQRIRTDGILKQISSYIPEFPIYPPEFSWIREEEPGTPAILAGTLESGSNVVYLAADIDRCYGKYRIPDHQRLLTNCVLWASGNHIPVTVSAPGHVNCNAYLQQGRLLVHLVNLCGCDSVVGTQTENYPVGPVIVKIKGIRVGKYARSLVSGKRIAVLERDDETYIEIEMLEEHELISFTNM